MIVAVVSGSKTSSSATVSADTHAEAAEAHARVSAAGFTCSGLGFSRSTGLHQFRVVARDQDGLDRLRTTLQW